MILGLGSDLIDIRRIEKVLERSADRFLARVYTSVEIAKAERRREAGMKGWASTLAKRFAAKEACSKALGTGISQGVNWKGMGVVSLPSGKPTLALEGGALRRLEALTPLGMQARIELTMTDEYPYAYAMVIISAEMHIKNGR